MPGPGTEGQAQGGGEGPHGAQARRGGTGARRKGAGRGGRRMGHGIDAGGGVRGRRHGGGARIRGGNMSPGTFGCGCLGLLFRAVRFLSRAFRGRNGGRRDHGGGRGRGRASSLAGQRGRGGRGGRGGPGGRGGLGQGRGRKGAHGHDSDTHQADKTGTLPSAIAVPVVVPVVVDVEAPRHGSEDNAWDVEPFKADFYETFESCGSDEEKISEALMSAGGKAVDIDTLDDIWVLSDIDHDGMLDQDEFAVAMFLCCQLREGHPLPDSLPGSLVPPSKQG